MENEKYFFDEEEIEIGFDDFLANNDGWEYNYTLADAFNTYILSEHFTKLKDPEYSANLYEYAQKTYPNNDNIFELLKFIWKYK